MFDARDGGVVGGDGGGAVNTTQAGSGSGRGLEETAEEVVRANAVADTFAGTFFGVTSVDEGGVGEFGCFDNRVKRVGCQGPVCVNGLLEWHEVDDPSGDSLLGPASFAKDAGGSTTTVFWFCHCGGEDVFDVSSGFSNEKPVVVLHCRW